MNRDLASLRSLLERFTTAETIRPEAATAPTLPASPQQESAVTEIATSTGAVLDDATALPRISVRRNASPALPTRPLAKDYDLELVEELGRGGMGIVFVARQHSIPRDVAIKVPGDEHDPHSHLALVAEGKIAGSLEHPNIVPVHALGTDAEGRPVLIMKRIHGTSWSTLLHETESTDWMSWLSESPEEPLVAHLHILMQVCTAIHFAHEKGVLHRDIKPENVLVGRFGDLYVVDWGVAIYKEDAQDADFCGTPGYLAPEMAQEGTLDERTDVYLLGATLHEILTKKMRHDASSSIEAVRLALTSAPYQYDSEIPKELANLANRACSADPASRPSDAKTFRDDLRDYLAHRHSRKLTAQALQRLAELRGMAEGSEASHLREFDRLTGEVRFGLRLALEATPDDQEAKRGLSDLEALLDNRRKRMLELERMATDRDERVGAGARARTLLVVAAIAIALSTVYALVAREMTPGQLLIAPMLLVAVLGGAAFRYRHYLLQNQLGRQSIILLLGLLGFMLVNRGFNYLDPASLGEVFARDSFILAGGFFVVGLTMFRWALWLAGIALVMAGICIAVPSAALTAFGAGTVLFSMLAAWFSRQVPDKDESASS